MRTIIQLKDEEVRDIVGGRKSVTLSAGLGLMSTFASVFRNISSAVKSGLLKTFGF